MQDWLQFILLDPFGYIAFPRSPEEGQAWMQSHYVGLIPLILSGYFLFKGRRLSLAFILIALVSWSLAMGKGSFVYQFFFEVLPGFDRFRYPVKFILPLILVLSISAAWGWDRYYTSNPDDKKKVMLLGFSALLMVLFGLIDIFNISIIQSLEANGFQFPAFNQPVINLSNMQRLLGFSSLFVFFLFLMMKHPKKKNLWACFAVFIFFLDIFFSNYGKQEINATKNFDIVPPVTRFLMNDPGLFRVFVTLETEVLKKNEKVTRKIRGVEVRGRVLPVEFRGQNRVQQLDGWNVIRKKSLRKILNQVGAAPLENKLPLLRMANVKYIVHGTPLPLDNLPLAFEESPEYRQMLEKNVKHPPPLMRVYENPIHLGRAFLAGNCQTISDATQLNNELLNPEWDPEIWVYLPESPPDLPCLSPTATAVKGEGTVKLIGAEKTITAKSPDPVSSDGFAPGEYRFLVDSVRQQFLVLSDSYYPGWEAFIDDRPVTIYRANQAFRAIVIPPGKHEVEFRYRPKSFLYGAWISGVSLIAGVAFVFVSTKRRRKAGINIENENPN
ncbi:MAG: YfhO family protein [Candidatus Nitronauta litoralis]|uniref:YfhO family protein n=1 Tax=Candidatus Nitronauta litoralis TaxID=2705533 RepID=A0A7T0BUB5_9BACT|nr:MAG: YfhO family protein [Candidatus Nitronauta litoralis]